MMKLIVFTVFFWGWWILFLSFVNWVSPLSMMDITEWSSVDRANSSIFYLIGMLWIILGKE